MAEHDPSDHGPAITRLTPADGQRVDAQLDPAAADAPPADATERDPQVQRVLALIDHWPADAGEGEEVGRAVDPALVRQTMARIETEQQQQQLAQQAHALAAGGPAGGAGSRWSLGQMLSLAGMVLIGVSLLLPVLASSRQISRQIACQRNLAEAGQAIAGYAADHAGTLPRGKVKPGIEWWHVGQPNRSDGLVRSNSAHLYLLVRDENDYLEPETLTCPTNPHAQPERLTDQQRDWPNHKAVCFSYQNQYTQAPIQLERDPDLAVLADKNPLFIVRTDKMTQAKCPPDAPTRLHDRRGQNVLTADGRVSWRTRPTLHRRASPANAAYAGRTDNIWTAEGITRYQGNESPRHDHDSFLVP